MRRFALLFSSLSLVVLLVLPTHSYAQNGNDRIQRRNGNDTGKITEITALTVTISKRGVDSKINAEEIRKIRFAGEPAKLNTARNAIERGQYQQALDTLKKIDATKISREAIQQELAYLTAYCTSKLALAGHLPTDQAIKLVDGFIASNRKSFHLASAIELSGDLALSAKNYSAARKNYAKLAKAPTPYFKARAAVLVGSVYQAEGKHNEALAEFEKAHAGDDSQAIQATLRQAISLTATGQADQSSVEVNSIIAAADADDDTLLAQAYNVLGECFLQTDRKKLARDAFLHVDILFASVPEQRAKALYQLSQLWPTLGHPQRAADAGQRLKDEYPNSPWANR